MRTHEIWQQFMRAFIDEMIDGKEINLSSLHFQNKSQH